MICKDISIFPEISTDLIVQERDPFGKLLGIGNGRRKEDVMHVIRQENDRFLPNHSPF